MDEGDNWEKRLQNSSRIVGLSGYIHVLSNTKGNSMYTSSLNHEFSTVVP